jgi:hypothetical protein
VSSRAEEYRHLADECLQLANHLPAAAADRIDYCIR